MGYKSEGGKDGKKGAARRNYSKEFKAEVAPPAEKREKTGKNHKPDSR
jgi:hypothetical protein